MLGPRPLWTQQRPEQARSAAVSGSPACNVWVFLGEGGRWWCCWGVLCTEASRLHAWSRGPAGAGGGSHCAQGPLETDSGAWLCLSRQIGACTLSATSR